MILAFDSSGATHVPTWAIIAFLAFIAVLLVSFVLSDLSN